MKEVKYKVSDSATGDLIGYERLWSGGTDSAWQRSNDGEEWTNGTFVLDEVGLIRSEYTGKKSKSGEEVYEDDLLGVEGNNQPAGRVYFSTIGAQYQLDGVQFAPEYWKYMNIMGTAHKSLDTSEQTA